MKPQKYDTLTENFVGAASGGDISRILKSMCPAFLLNQPKTLKFKEENCNGIY